MYSTRRLTRLTQLTLASCFVALGLGTVSTPASAESIKTKYWQSSASTIGSTSTCQTDADGSETCTTYYVFLVQMSKDQDDAQACASNSSWTQHPDGSRTYGLYEFGCTPIDRRSYSIDQHLDQASLAPTTITLEQLDSPATRTVTVAATWTGSGERIVSEYEYHMKDNGCHVKSDYGYSRREASGSLSFAGVQHSFDSATMLISEGKTRVRCELGA